MQAGGKTVFLEGAMGAGKTTLSLELAEALGPYTLLCREPDEKGGLNPYLSDYYGDAGRWSFTMQAHLLSLRYRMHLQAQWHCMNTGHHAVMDRSFQGDTAFARLQLKHGLMGQREFETYRSLYHAMTASVLLPNFCIVLKVDPEVSARRINQRMQEEEGRGCEVAVDLQYLSDLNQEIEHMALVLKNQGVQVIEVPWNQDRLSKEDRKPVVDGLVQQILDHEPEDLFLDLHRRTI